MEAHPGWPLPAQNNNQYVSPSTHYFHDGNTPPRATGYVGQLPIIYDEKPPIEDPNMDFPRMPQRAASRKDAFYPSHEDVLGPHITQGLPLKPQRKRFSWKAGFDRLYESWVDNWWLWELLSWCVSAICMGVIGLVLLLVDDKPTGANDITLNSIISVLSGVAKAALLLPTAEALGQLKWSWFWRDSKKVRDFETFDAASRGPWGSFMLLIRTKGKTLATVGAVIVILSVAVDPFFQQLVIFPQRWVPQGNGTMPQVQHYYGTQTNITSLGVPFAGADPAMTSFIEPLFFGNDLEPKIPLSCPTSNCTWEPFDSLSICGTCTDISDMLQYDCRNASVDWLHTATGWTPGNPAEVFPVIETCGFFVNATSDAPLLMTGYIPKGGNETLQEVLVSRLFPLLDWNTLHTYWDGSINFKNVTNPIADYIAVSAPNGVPSVYGNSTPVAQECVLNWCTRNFNMSYYLGNLTQKPIGDPVQQTGSAPFPWWFGPEGTSNSPDYRYDASFAFDPPGQPLNFTVSNDTMFETVVITKQFLPAFMTGRSGNPVLQYRYANFDGAPYVRDLFVNPLQEIASLHDRISKIMTNVLLTSPTGANLRVGTAWGQVVFVNVRWVWMSLPFALLFFSLIFLLATIFKSADEQGDIGIWKTSALAVLLNGLRGDVQRDIGTSNEMGEARNNADNVRVKLMLSKKGRYRLSGTSGPSWMASPKDGLGGRTWI